MQTSAKRLLETIIREELSLLQEQDEKTIGLYLSQLNQKYPQLYDELFKKQPSYLNTKSMNQAVFKELSTSTDSKIKNVYLDITKQLIRFGQIPKLPGIGDPAIYNNILPGFVNKVAMDKQADERAKALQVKTPTAAEQRQNIQIANKIINARGRFIDDETGALKAIQSIKTQDQYYWVNFRVCNYMKRKNMSGYGYSLPKYLMTFSGRNLIGTDKSIRQNPKTGKPEEKSYGTVTKTVKSLAYSDQRDMFRINTELQWWLDVNAHLVKLESQNREKWESLKYERTFDPKTMQFTSYNYDPLYMHEMQIDSHIYRLNVAYGKANKGYQQSKNLTQTFSKNPYGGAFNSISLGREYMDDDPDGFLSNLGIIVSLFSGPVALLLAAGLTGAAGVSKWEQGEYAEAGSEFIFAALFTVGVILKIPSITALGSASKLKIANAMASSNFTFLNQLEMLALTDLAKLAKTKSAMVKRELNKLIRQRAQNIVKNQRFKVNESIPNYIIKEIADGTAQASAVGLQILNRIKEPLAGITLWWKAETDWWPSVYDNLKIDGKSAFVKDIETASEQWTQQYANDNDIDILDTSPQEQKEIKDDIAAILAAMENEDK
jgi:hypothetical protein